MNIIKADTKTGKAIYATIVILFAVVFPLYLFQEANITELKISALTIFLSLLYFTVVSGFVLLIFNKKGMRLEFMEIDKNTKQKYNKLYLVIVALVWLNIAYFSVKLFLDLQD